MVRGVGVETILKEILSLRWKLLILFPVYPFVYAFNTLGWALAFPRPLGRQVPFNGLYAVRLIGETLNSVIPWTASLGGEPMKAVLLKRKYGVPLSESTASFLIVHTTLWISLNLFVTGGLLFSARDARIPETLLSATASALAALALGAALLFAAMQFGVFARLYHILTQWKFLKPVDARPAEAYAAVDADMKRYYARQFWRPLGSAFFNTLAWLCGVAEVYAMARILGIPLSLGEAWLVEAMIQLVRIITFFIPASIGAQEGGIVFILTQLGFAGPVSLVFALLRRLREAVWIALGLLLWASRRDSAN